MVVPEVPRLLDHAIRLLGEHLSTPRDGGAWRFGPLVIVAPALDAATVHAATAVGRARLAAGDVVSWAGGTLDRDIARALSGDRLDHLVTRCAACRLVVVDRIDGVAGAEPQRALVHLLDTSTAAGTAWCVSVARLPAAGLSPQCASRLGGGLVVPAPASADRPPVAVPPSLGRVIRAAARHHDVPVEAVLGPSRSRTVAAARSLAMYLARTLTGRSLQAIGSACGDRDHTTVLHAVRVCGVRIGHDPAFAADVERLAAALAAPGVTTATTGRRRRSGVGSAPLDRVLSNRRRDRRRRA